MDCVKAGLKWYWLGNRNCNVRFMQEADLWLVTNRLLVSLHLLLIEWREELAWLPVETIIHNQQKSYYQVLGECERASDCTLFIDFMLEKLIEGLSEGIATEQSRTAKVAVEMAVEMAGEISASEYQLLTVLADKPHATVAELIEVLGRSRRTIERNIKSLQEKGKLQRMGATKKGFWRVI